MNKSQLQPQEAIRRVDEIYALIKGNLKGALSGPLMLVNGAMIACIPIIEVLLNRTIDPILAGIAPHNAAYILFAFKTAFYWGTFALAAHFVSSRTPEVPNTLVNRLFELSKLFPLIFVTTGGMLALIGQSDLIAPILLIMIGTVFVIFGEFSSAIVSRIAWSDIIAGFAGIYLTTLGIAHLWAYLVIFLGLSFVLMGILLNAQQKHD